MKRLPPSTTLVRAWTLGALAAVAALALASAPAQAALSGASAGSHHALRYRPEAMPSDAKRQYLARWGVDRLRVERMASGSLIRFSYRVVDPARAEVLNAERDIPYLIAPTRGVVLQVPKIEQVGDLRQKGPPVAGMIYWMAFSNKNQPVKTGDRINIAIGTFQADGLIVE